MYTNPVPLCERMPMWLFNPKHKEHNNKHEGKYEWPNKVDLWLTYRDLVVVIEVIGDDVRAIPGRVCCVPDTNNLLVKPNNITHTLISRYVSVGRNILHRDPAEPPIEMALNNPHLLKRTELRHFIRPEFVLNWFDGTYSLSVCIKISEQIIDCLW